MDSETIKVILVALTPVMLALVTVLQLWMASRNDARKAKQERLDKEQERLDKEAVRLAVKDVADKAVVAVGKVEEVKQALNDKTSAQDQKLSAQDKKLDRVVTTGDDILHKVNGGVTAHLTLVVDMAEEMARMAPTNEAHRLRAVTAKKALSDHLEQLKKPKQPVTEGEKQNEVTQ